MCPRQCGEHGGTLRDFPDYINPPTDFPERPPSSPRRRRLLALAALLLVAVIAGSIALSKWVDLLWFQSLGFGAVFWKTVLIETGVFLVATAVTFALLYGAFTAMRRLTPSSCPVSASASPLRRRSASSRSSSRPRSPCSPASA